MKKITEKKVAQTIILEKLKDIFFFNLSYSPISISDCFYLENTIEINSQKYEIDKRLFGDVINEIKNDKVIEVTTHNKYLLYSVYIIDHTKILSKLSQLKRMGASLERIENNQLSLTMDTINGNYSKCGKPFFLNLRINTNRDIKINNIFISRPEFGGINDEIINFLYKNNKKTFTREELFKHINKKKKDFNTFLNEINIKGEIRKYLFDSSKTKIRLKNKVFIEDAEDIKKINKELEDLKKNRNQ